MTLEGEKVGSLRTALAHTERLLLHAPQKAEEQAREILKVVPANRDAQRLLALALKKQGQFAPAREILEKLAREVPQSAQIRFDLGQTLADAGESTNAIAAFRKTLKIAPGFAPAWLALADQLSLSGETKAADAAYAEHIRASVNHPGLLKAAAALCENRLAIAERLLRAHLMEQPTDVAAIRMLAETGSRLGQYADAESLLKRCLELAPGFAAARNNYASILHRQGKFAEGLEQTEILLKAEPANPNYRALKAALLGRIGDFDRATEVYETLLKEHPNQPRAWLSFGHALRAVGRQTEGVGAYRKSIALMPSFGEAYWSLANLKTFRFTEIEIGTMRKELERRDLPHEDRLHLLFALSKALEDEGQYEESFERYQKANALRYSKRSYDAEKTSENVKRQRAFFTAAFFDARAGSGDVSPDPIFVVGLPRAGSTLVEQILSSHSAVEGTMELSDIISISQRLGGRHRKSERSAYPEILASLSHEELEGLGREYLERTRIQRHLGRPHFIDKMPNNFLHVGLIHLILPNAKIIDARRHPLACCLSGFKQHFARGQDFTYSLDDIGRYYRDYVELMSHFDQVLPGRIYRVIYEQMIENPADEIGKLLSWCGLPFEPSCLKFYENERAVRTASSEQVRQPIFSEAVDHWRNYEPWLGPLKEALGPVLETYPLAP